MGALVGLGVGVGLLLIWSAFALPRTAARPRHRPRRRWVASSAAPALRTSRRRAC